MSETTNTNTESVNADNSNENSTQLDAAAAAATMVSGIPVPSSKSNIPTPASSVTGIPVSKLKAPTNFGSNNSVSKIGRACCTHTTPKAGPPPRDTKSMSRESDDNLSSINSTYTDLYQETVKRFTRSSLSPSSDLERNSPSRRSYKSTTTTATRSDNERRTSYDYYLEATGRRRSSDHGAVLTADTEQFIIGQRVWVGGIRSGQIAYIGETHFAPGEWAGVVLDEPNGKNDGCVSGKRYFQCEPKRGIFSRLTRLTLAPLSGAQTPTSPLSKNSPERSRTVSPTSSIRSSMLRSPGTGKNGLTVGDRIIVSSGFGSRPGILRYLGETQFAPGNWCGVELDEPSGKNDGAVDGIRYFECKQKYGVFVPIAKVSLSPSSKKSRLSRAGSRESLTSIGTMNSIATTNTSRMRMNAQRKSNSSIKPIVSTPKSQFSMQDLLRDRQNHIEQLLIERDQEREDAQNHTVQLQKNINELKLHISQLESELALERKKSEDLQFSIDEATFCGDELNAQTQVYKEKIHDLEKKITQLVSASPSLQSEPLLDVKATDVAAAARIAELEAKLNELQQINDARFAEFIDEEKRLQENIKYLQNQNDLLQKELLDKDESLEKFSLSQSGIDNLRRELALLKEENEKQSQQANSEYQQKLQERDAEVKRLNEELISLKSTIESIESERAHSADECQVMQVEVKMRDEQLQQLNEKLDELSTQLSVQHAENAALDEMLKTQKAGSSEEQASLQEKITEIGKLKAENESLTNLKTELEAQLHKANETLQTLAEQQKSIEQKLKEANEADVQKDAALSDLKTAIDNIKQEITTANAENEKLKVEVEHLKAVNVQAQAKEANLSQDLTQKQNEIVELNAKLAAATTTIESTQSELISQKQKSEEKLAARALELESLNAEVSKLRSNLTLHESQASSSANEMAAKISELEQQSKQLVTQLKASEDSLVEAQKNYTALSAQHAQVSQELKTTTESLQTTGNTLSKLTQEHEAAKESLRALEAQLKQSEEANAQRTLELGDLTRKQDALNTKCENLAKQNETLQAELQVAHATSAELQSTIKQRNEELSAKQQTQAALESEINTARLQLESELETLKQTLQHAQKYFEELNTKHVKTKEELAAKCAQITTLEEQTIKQELSISDANRQQENLQKRYDALAAQNESLQQDLTTMRTTSTDSNAELLKLAQENVAKQKAYEELCEKSSSERAALEGQLQASQQRIDALCSQVEILTQELKVASEESFKRYEQLKLAEEQSSKQTLDLSDLGRKLEALNAKCEKLEEQNSKLQEELSMTRNTSSDTNAKVLSLNEKLASKQKQLEASEDAASAARLKLESQLQELQQNLQASQNDVERLNAELAAANAAKEQHANEFAALQTQLNTKAQTELEECKQAEAAARKQLIDEFEAKLKSSEKTKCALDEAITSLQQQLKLLQEELLKSQLDFRAKEEHLQKQLEALSLEKTQIANELQQLQNASSATASSAAHDKAALETRLTQLEQQLKDKDAALQAAAAETAQLQLQQNNSSVEFTQLKDKIKELEEALALTRTEVAHREQVAREDAQKMNDLRTLLDTVKQSNANISATNAELSAAMEILEAEKCEMANIFEIFEMESDHNSSKLIQKLAGMKQAQADAQTQLQENQIKHTDMEEKLNALNVELQNTQSALTEQQTVSMELTAKLQELQQANAELNEALKTQTNLEQKGAEYDAQLAEYKKVIDEMDEESKAKTEEFQLLQTRIQQLELELHQRLSAAKIKDDECKQLTRKLESLDLEKTREILALQTKLNGAANVKHDKIGDGNDLSDNETNLAQINFLNSIIADMQKKNDTLKAKIEALEALPTDFTKPHAFDIITKRKPAPRVFCDICDVFDKHETEDCPLQASDDYSPPPSLSGGEANNNEQKKERKLPAPRKYCETCEVFGHESGECEDDETY